MIFTADLVAGFLIGLFVGIFFFPRKPKQKLDGVIEFDPEGEEILSFELWHNLYSLSQKDLLAIRVKHHGPVLGGSDDTKRPEKRGF